MTRTSWSVLFGLVVFVSTAAAQVSPLAQIPAKAPVVIAVHGVKRSTDRLMALVKNALPEQVKGIQAFIDEMMKKSPVGNRQIKGLKDDGPLFLVLHSLPRLDKLEPPSLGLIARVADYKAFRDSLLTAEERRSLAEDKANGWEEAALGTGKIFFIPRQDYAVVCFHQPAAAAFAKKEPGPGFEGTLPKPLAQKLLDSDIALFVDWAAVTKQYDPIIKKRKLDLAGLIDQDGEESDKLDKAQAETIKGIAGALLQLVDDSSYFFLSCDFRPQGLALHLSAGLAADSKTNLVLKTMKPSPLTGLEALPAGFTTYTAVDLGPEALKAFRPLVTCMLAPSGERGDQAAEKTLDDALDDLIDAKPRLMCSAARMGTDRAAVQVWQVADAAKGAAAQLRMFRALKEGGSFQLVPVKAKPAVKADAQAYRDTKLHRVSLKWDLDKLADTLLGAEESSAMLKKFSGEGTTLWFGKVGKHNVQVSAATWKAAADYLDKYFKKEDAIGTGKAFMEARKSLPREATLVTLIHVPRYGQYFAEFLYEAFKAQKIKGIKPPVAPENKASDSYLGMAVTLQAGAASFDLWVPAGAASEVSRILEPYLKQLGEK
jgi:hypothetical protein